LRIIIHLVLKNSWIFSIRAESSD